MKTSFGFFNSDVILIRDWHQLLKINSINDDVKCSVNDVSDDICEGISITLYNKNTKLNYITFFVEGNSSKYVDLTDIVLTSQEACNILNKFGFKVFYVNQFNITKETHDLLASLSNLGFKFIFKNCDSEIYASKYAISEPNMSNSVLINSLVPEAINCDFTFMSVNHAYSIEDLLYID